MRVMVIGGGGREYAIAERLASDPRVEYIYALPGNGGMKRFAECVGIKATDITGIVRFAVENSVDFAVVTPDDPLALGAVDELSAMGVACFGPTKAAARIEASKSFAKELMKKYGIPTAESRTFTDEAEALEYVSSAPLPTVVKADGLALGKGVFICRTREEAEDAVTALLSGERCGDSGKKILIEEYLEGPEVSVLTLTDGSTILPLVSSMDHKTIGEGGKGPNTGGMGVIAPNPFYTDDIAQMCMDRIFKPTVEAMRREGCPFTGCLYFGLMLTGSGPKVIEYNCRFGDPETQTVLPLIENGLLDLMLATANSSLKQHEIKVKNGACCCVVLASAGYPGAYKKGLPITADAAFPQIASACGGELVHAGTGLTETGYVTAGGRVLNCVALGKDLEAAVKNAYSLAEHVHFDGAYMRRDIGKTALERE